MMPGLDPAYRPSHPSSPGLTWLSTVPTAGQSKDDGYDRGRKERYSAALHNDGTLQVRSLDFIVVPPSINFTDPEISKGTPSVIRLNKPKVRHHPLQITLDTQRLIGPRPVGEQAHDGRSNELRQGQREDDPCRDWQMQATRSLDHGPESEDQGHQDTRTRYHRDRALLQ